MILAPVPTAETQRSRCFTAERHATIKSPEFSKENRGFEGFFKSESGGTRTLDPRIKSPLLYRLSYALLDGWHCT